MGAIFKQLVRGREIPYDIREGYRKGRRPRLRDLIRILRLVISWLPNVFICIDGLDECPRRDLFELLESLRDIVQESPQVRIFLTGRPYVKGDIQRYFTKVVVIPIHPNPDDIMRYLRMRLRMDDEPEAMDNDLEADIVEVIMDKLSDMCVGTSVLTTLLVMYTYRKITCRFLLVSLNIEAILGEVTIGQRRKKLKEMARGNGLSDAYTTTLSRLKAQKKNRAELGLKVLMWVLHSERPLRAEELGHALGVEIGSQDLDPAYVPALQTLLSSCLGLVTLEASSSTLRLVHYTLHDHLLSDPTLFHSPHSTIAEVCLTYLNSRTATDLSPILRSAPSTMPLLEYASFYWGEHTRRGMTQNVKALALRLLDRFEEHISAQLLLLRYSCDIYLGPHSMEGGPRGFTGLHWVVFLGIVELVAPMLEMEKWDVNVANYIGSTALTLAAQRGQEGIVKVLLERKEVNPNQGDTKHGRTPLWLAARNGHQGVVKMLLDRDDVNLNQVDTEYGATPLSCAVGHGHEGVVKMLLERVDVHPARPIPTIDCSLSETWRSPEDPMRMD